MDVYKTLNASRGHVHEQKHNIGTVTYNYL